MALILPSDFVVEHGEEVPGNEEADCPEFIKYLAQILL